ncbi:hypothetical protein AMJ85_11990 [candidate division BRC1 bacterium SM23_51]|nr:MAG: hypothetical protein AMJ85_11990 [candidate division BRC1 bacterium SM23_51]
MKLGQCPHSALTCIFVLFFIASRTCATARGDDSPECATCAYLSEQFARLRAGLQPLEDTRYVPKGYWDRVCAKGGTAHEPSAGVSEFPNVIYSPDANRTDADGDGLLECRYRIDLSDLVTSGGYSLAEKDALENEVRKALNLWNTTLAYVGFEFREVTDGTERLVINAIGGGSWTGQATLFGAIKGTNPVLQLNYNYSSYGAWQYLVEPATKDTLIDHPPGNPYGCLVDRNLLLSFSRYYPAASTVLHEAGHSVGLMHTYEAISNVVQGLGYEENISWLDYPTIPTAPNNFVPSTRVGGEDVLAGLFSRALNNSFMTYDRQNYILYPDVTPEMKACIAHYYQSLDPSGAQSLLDLARGEHSLYSPLDDPGVIQESEPNDSTTQAINLTLGMSVLGAISSWNTLGSLQSESYADLGDCYRLVVREQDLHTSVILDIDHGSQFFGKRLEVLDTDGVTVLATSDDGSAIPGGYPDPGSAVSGFSFYDDPYIEWTPTIARIYYVRITRKTEQQWYGDYFLVTGQGPRTAARSWQSYE